MQGLLTGLLLLQSPRGLPEVRAVPYEGPPADAAEAPSTPSTDERATEPASAMEPEPVPPSAAVSPATRPEVRRGGEGVVWSSEGGRFYAKLGLRGQLRYTVADAPGEDPENLLQIRRGRIKMNGNAFGRNNQYNVELGLSPRDMRMNENGPRQTPFLDWYVEFTQLRDATVRIGQYKIPYSRTRVQSSGDLQFVDRSIANGEFNLDRDVGLDVRSYDLFGLGHLRYYAGVFLGEGRDPNELNSFEMMYLGRFEVLPFGLYDKEDHESDLARTRRPRLSIGAAYVFIDGATRDRGVLGSAYADEGTTDFHNATADLSFKYAGFTVLGEGFFRQGERKAGPSIPAGGLAAARVGYGWSAQSGYLLGRFPLEFAGRYGEVHPMGVGPVPRQRQPTVVTGYYFFRHSVKLQLDYSPTWTGGWDETPSHMVRLQLQAEL